jgi:hypothetical protein
MDEYSHKIVDITPEYLLNLSKHVDLMSKHYLHHRMGALTQDFSNTLTTQFNELTHFLNLYHNDSVMRTSSLLKCKAHLELYTLSKISVLVARENPELGAIIEHSNAQLREVLGSLESLIL